ncbi:HDOD domain-containing protein [Marinobacter sp. NP-4(2019)]|uniref:HDOD domain-containing protein n=1 Tax=Marinobacter sp. NP-4(2019) TaxID=2488665 RepID=UPI000FC3D307|nr:HDOD domain-containing protein [Marinobacter sp. NP-4(2019)]AZT84966.1 HDOD domain-containing protein [Marinobacter sp. NP-4(2019)]
MPGILSWISGLFSDTRPEPRPRSPEPRLFNPVIGDTSTTEQDALLVQNLEGHLFCWLLDSPPSALNTGTDEINPVLKQLEQRLHDQSIEELPRRPLTLPMLMQALSDETSDRHQVTGIILSDPALTDQLLQIANSPYFRPGDQTIESVDHAVFVLGLDGIRSVISAAVLRPMMAARNSREALFAQRVWRWGLTCARAAELIAKIQGQDTSAHFMVGLLPALSYITLRREIHRIYLANGYRQEPGPAVIRYALARYHWATTQLLANEWNLPPKYHAYLLAAERPAPEQQHTPLNDGMIMGTREALRHAHQRNMAEEKLLSLVRLNEEQFAFVRKALLRMLED